MELVVASMGRLEHVVPKTSSSFCRKKQKVMNSRASNQVNIHSVVGTGGVMMDSVKNQEGISHDNRKTILEAGGRR
jgi:hypothetical protein